MASAAVMPAWLSIVEKSVFRFDESESARKEAAPSLSFVTPSLREEVIHVDNNEPEFIPVFEADGVNQIVTLKVSILLLFFLNCMSYVLATKVSRTKASGFS
jgi:hypothetical protein